MAVAIGVVVVIAFFLLIFLGSAIRVLREYERGVIFRLGRLIAQKGPGLILLIPVIDRMVGSISVRSPSTSRLRR
jgi:regulator of protease activity HflC (stomatin/prohibitin superfamily)